MWLNVALMTPLNSQMVQAHWAFFGSHTYKGIDDSETHHIRWGSDSVIEI